MPNKRYERTRSEVVELCHLGLDPAAFFDKVRRSLSRAVAFDGCCWLTFDPATALPTGHIAHNSLKPEDVPVLARNEFLEDDVNKLAELARERHPSGILSEATGGHPERSPRFRDLLQPNGFGAEMRASFVADGDAWGGMAMYRTVGAADFTPAERKFAAGLSPLLAEGVRRSILITSAPAAEGDDAPGLIILDSAGVIETMNPAAKAYVDDMVSPDPASGGLPNLVHAVAFRALLAARGGDAGLARARVATSSGKWLILHGSLIGASDEGRTAVIIEPARSPEIASLIVSAYGLSRREREITQLVVRGLSTEEIAGALHLSPYTVQDHLKSIFSKVGVGNRRELVAQIFFRHYAPNMGPGTGLRPDGWFAAPSG
jgi:DNA-binding CsgD family transcriptional regulator